MKEAFFSAFWVSVPLFLFIWFDFFYFLGALASVWLLLYQVPKFFGLEPMIGNDSLFMMDSRTNKLLVTSIATFSEKISVKQYKRCARKSFKADPRTQKYIVKYLGRYYWKKDFFFDEKNHFTVHSQKINKSGLEHFTNQVLTKDLKPNQPPFEIHFFKNYEGSGTAVLFRFHHSFADGLAVISMMTWCADSNSEKIFYSPPHIPFIQKVFLHVLSVFTFFYHILRVLMQKQNSNKLHCQKLSGVKAISWSTEIPLGGILAHCKSIQVTFNDFLTAVVLDSLEKYSGEKLGKLIALIPFSLRGQPLDGTFLPLQNYISVFPVTFPEVSEDIIEKSSQLFKDLKSSVVPLVMYFGMKICASVLPKFLSRLLVYFTVNKATLLFSNVPGPKLPIFYSGKKFQSLISMSPNMANCGISITSLSYSGSFIMTCYSDVAVIPDPSRFIRTFESVLQKYLKK